MNRKSFTMQGTFQDLHDWLRRFQRKQYRRWPPAMSSLTEKEQGVSFTYLVPLSTDFTTPHPIVVPLAACGHCPAACQATA